MNSSEFALFYCKCKEVCELRTEHKDLFVDLFRPLHAFTRPSNTEFIPFLACFQVMTDPEINAFLNQDSRRLLKLLSELISIFDAG